MKHPYAIYVRQNFDGVFCISCYNSYCSWFKVSPASWHESMPPSLTQLNQHCISIVAGHTSPCTSIPANSSLILRDINEKMVCDDFRQLPLSSCYINEIVISTSHFSGGGTEIRSGELAWEAAKLPIIRTKCLHAKVKIVGARAPLAPPWFRRPWHHNSDIITLDKILCMCMEGEKGCNSPSYEVSTKSERPTRGWLSVHPGTALFPLFLPATTPLCAQLGRAWENGLCTYQCSAQPTTPEA